MKRIERNHEGKISYHLLKIVEITLQRLRRAYQKGVIILDEFLKKQIRMYKKRRVNNAKKIIKKWG